MTSTGGPAPRTGGGTRRPAARAVPLPRLRLVCSGCGWEAPAGELPPFRCPRHRLGDDIEHVLERRMDEPAAGAEGTAREIFRRDEPNPLVRYREFLGSWRAARAGGLADEEFVELARSLDRAIAEIDGRGLSETPFGPHPELAAELGLGAVWVKDETGNVAGSHKARHLAGALLWIEVARRLGSGPDPRRPLAVSSCGNAALAAAVVARAADRPLRVFIPEGAEPAITHRLRRLGAQLELCNREPGVAGDPCYHAFVRAVEGGGQPFTCQGPENGLVIEGGQTLAWEMVSELLRGEAVIDRVFVQVGGGALATAVSSALEEAWRLGLLPALPRLHAVQTAGAWPLVRAWRRLVERIVERHGPELSAGGEPPADDAGRAEAIRRHLPWPRVEGELRWAATHRSALMWPWESEPYSIADGILDDETYDWLGVVRGMLHTGGHPLVVSEERLRAAHDLARRATGIPVSPTGSAGLAGLMELAGAGGLHPDERVAVLFTGVER